MKKKVLVIDPLWEFYRDGLYHEFPDLEINGAATSAEVEPWLPDTEIICAKTTWRTFSEVLLERAVRLQWIQGFTAGTDAVTRLAALRPEVTLTSMRGIHGPQMAEMAMMLMVALARDFPRLLRNQKARHWTKFEQRQLAGKTVLILGIGVSGAALAVRAKAFDMRVVGITGTPRPLPDFDAVLPRERLLDAAAEADFLVVLVPYTPANEKLIDARVLGAMKSEAYFINIARGGVCDEEALLKVLREKRIAGAALDVFAKEPLDATSPFWDLDNVIVTPHTAGDSDRYHHRALELTINNMRKYLAGRADEMENLVLR